MSFGVAQLNYVSPKIPISSNRSLRFLESLVLRNERYIGDQYEFLIEPLRGLKSISFKCKSLGSWTQLSHMMSEFSKLPVLQEIYLSCINAPVFAFVKAFKELSEKGMHKKVKLEFGSEMINLEEILTALKACKLTHFSLKAAGLVKSIAQFLEAMGHLDALELHIFNSKLFAKNNNFEELCKQIGQLQALRSLKLNFQTEKKRVPKDTRISNFLPHLSDVFEQKPTKIETFYIECTIKTVRLGIRLGWARFSGPNGNYSTD